MSQIKLNPIRYYDISDIYSYEVDNRPIYDLRSNIDTLNSGLNTLGFYQTMAANPESEPPGGFSAMTVAYVGDNSRLFPIDLTISPLIIDYTKYPLYLVLGKTTDNMYNCISFSSSLTLPSFYDRFLPDSVGKALKLGPGGTLVDELYFDLYYSSQTYQNIIIGKVLTTTSISFGGNQVSTLSDNHFLAKNRNDHTTGLLTTYIDNSVYTDAHKNILLNNTGSQYPFMTYRDYIGDASMISLARPIPIYFSAYPLETDPITGSFLEGNITSLLNEVHFRTPAVISGQLYNPKYSTSGVNIASLTDYSNSFMLHNKAMSTLLNENNQLLGTSLTIDASVNPAASFRLPVISNVESEGFGSSINIINGLPSLMFTAISEKESGVHFGNYGSGTGAFLGYVEDSTLLTDAQIIGLTAENPDSILLSNQQSLIDLASGSHFLIHAKRNASAQTAIIMRSDDYLILSADNVLVNSSLALRANSVVPKSYVDGVVKAIAKNSVSIPLTGTETDVPITGTLRMDLTASTASATKVLDFLTLAKTEISSSNPVEFLVSGADGQYQTLRGNTPVASSVDAHEKDLVNRGYLTTAIRDVITGAVGSGAISFVTLAAPQTLTGVKTFSLSPVFTNATKAITLAPAGIATTGTAVIASSTNTVRMIHNTTSNLVSLQVATPVSDALPNNVATVEYVQNAISTALAGEFGSDGVVFASWEYQTPDRAVLGGGIAFENEQFAGRYYSCMPTAIPSAKSDTFFNWFTYQDGSLLYKGTVPGVFLVNTSDGRFTSPGQKINSTMNIYRAITKIATTSGNVTTVLAANVHQDDTAVENSNVLVGTSCSAVVKLTSGMILHIGSELSDRVAASIVRIR